MTKVFHWIVQSYSDRRFNAPVVSFFALVALLLMPTAAEADADISLSGSAPAEMKVAEAVSFSFTLINNGPDAASGVFVEVFTPPGLDVSSGNGGGGDCNFVYAAGDITGFECSFDSLPTGESRTVRVGGLLTMIGDQTAAGTVSATTTDPDGTNNSATATVSAQAAIADLGTFLSTPLTVLHSDRFQYRLSLINYGPDRAPEFSSTLMLPSGVSDPTGFFFPGGSSGCVIPGATLCGKSPFHVRPYIQCFFPGYGGPRSVTCRSQETFHSGSTNYALISVFADTVGIVDATASIDPIPLVIDDDGSNDADAASVEIEPMADLSLDVSSPGNALLGFSFFYTMTVTNAGPDDASGTALSAELPAGVTLVSVVGASCSGSTSLTCDYGSVASGTEKVVNLEVRADELGNSTATGSVMSDTGDIDDTDLSDDATTTVTLEPVTGTELELTASVTPEFPIFNQLVSCEFLLENNGPEVAEDIVVDASLPPDLQRSSLSWGLGGGSCSFTTTPIDGFSCTFPNLENGDSRTIRANLYADIIGTISSAAVVTTTTPDRVPSNNSASASTTIRPAEADVSIALGAPSIVTVGEDIEYRISLSSAGPEEVFAITGSVILPPEVSTPPSFSFAGGYRGCVMPGATVCGQSPFTVRPTTRCWFPGIGGDRSVTCEVADRAGVAPGGGGGSSGYGYIRVDAEVAGLATATATTEFDPGIVDDNSENNSTSVETLIVNPGETDVSLTKTAPESVFLNDSFDYVLTVRNNGPIDATAVTLSDTLPSEVELISATGTGVSCAGTSTVICGLGSMGTYQSKRVTIRVRATSTGLSANAASTSADEVDPNTENNSASTIVEIREPTSDLSLTVSAESTTDQGQRFILQPRVENLGPDRATNVRIRAELPDGMSFSYGYTNCYSVSNGFECNIGSLFTGVGRTMTVPLESSSPGTKQIAMTVSQNNLDPDPTNHELVLEIEIIPELVVSCPDDINVATDPGLATATVSPGEATGEGGVPPITVDGVRTDGLTLGAPYPIGTTAISWTATDSRGHRDFCQQNVVVFDDEQPIITVDPHGDRFIELETPDGSTASWTATATDAVDGPVPVSCSPLSGSIFPLGTTTVTCTAADAAGNSANTTFTVTVQDTTPPTINALAANPALLWPPNHKFVTVDVTVDVFDIDPVAICGINSVASNEPVSGLGHGDKAPDWGTPDGLAVELRAERSGSGVGRLYTLDVVCADSSGNQASVVTTVVVPHDSADMN